MVGVDLDGLNRANWKAAGIDLVAPGAEHLFAGLDALVGSEVIDEDLTCGTATENGTNASSGQEYAGAGRLVVDKQDLRGMGEDIAKLANDAVWGNDSLIGLEAIFRAFVNVDEAGEVVAAGANNLGGNRGGDIMLLEVQQGLQTMSLHRVFGKCRLFETQPGDLILEVMVLLAGVAQIDVVRPSVTDVVADAVKEALEWSDDRDGPVAEKGDLASIGSARFDGAAHLNGEADGLREQDRDEHQDVFKSCEERFHSLTMIIRELPRGRRWRNGCGRQLSFRLCYSQWFFLPTDGFQSLMAIHFTVSCPSQFFQAVILSGRAMERNGSGCRAIPSMCEIQVFRSA